MEGNAAEDMNIISPEDRELLSMYQHSFDDDKVDTQLVAELLLKIHTTQPEGAILVFLPGYDDIVSVSNAISHYSQMDRSVIFFFFTFLIKIDLKRNKHVFQDIS